jgi:hypothetical protein
MAHLTSEAEPKQYLESQWLRYGTPSFWQDLESRWQPYIYTIHMYAFVQICIVMTVVGWNAYIHTCTYTCMHSYVQAWMRDSWDVEEHLYTYIHTYIHIHVRGYIQAWMRDSRDPVYVHTHTHVQKWGNTCTHTYIHTRGDVEEQLYTYIQTRMWRRGKHLCTYIHTYTHTHTWRRGGTAVYMHTYTHT